MTLAKALAGGVAMGGLIATPAVAEKLKPGTHAATFGGNPLACRGRPGHHRDDRSGRPAGPGRSRSASGSGDGSRRCKERCPPIQEVRIKGAMIGVELTIDGAAVVQTLPGAAAAHQLHARHRLRLLPALNLTDEQIDEGCDCRLRTSYLTQIRIRHASFSSTSST